MSSVCVFRRSADEQLIPHVAYYKKHGSQYKSRESHIHKSAFKKQELEHNYNYNIFTTNVNKQANQTNKQTWKTVFTRGNAMGTATFDMI